MDHRAELNLKKSLWKLAYANRAISHVLTTCDYYLGHVRDETHPMAYPLMCAICVIYARPFTDNGGVGMISTKFARFDDPRLQRTHDLLWESRKRFYAHSDATVLTRDGEGEESAMQSLRVVVTRTEVPEGHSFNFSLAHPEVGLRGIVVPDVRDTCISLRERLVAEQSKVVGQLFSERISELATMMEQDRTDYCEIVVSVDDSDANYVA